MSAHEATDARATHAGTTHAGATPARATHPGATDARPDLLLVVPPLINPWAPGLQTPLVNAARRAAHRRTAVLDLNAVHTDWLLSPAGLAELDQRVHDRAPGSCADPNRLRRARIVAESTVAHIDRAKQTLRTVPGLADPGAVRRARTVLRNAGAMVSAAFAGLDFDLITNEGHYSPRSTTDVLAASRDPQRNVYRWCLDRLLAPSTLDGVQAVGVDLSADSQLVGALTMARFVAEHRPGLPVFAYGDYATRLTMAWQEVHPFLDLIGDVIGYEPEQAVVALADALLDGSARPVPGRVTSAGGRLHRWAPEPADLNALPAADFDALALDRYLGPGPVFPSYASRGCPWRCEFCSIPVTHGRFRRPLTRAGGRRDRLDRGAVGGMVLSVRRRDHDPTQPARRV